MCTTGGGGGGQGGLVTAVVSCRTPTNDGAAALNCYALTSLVSVYFFSMTNL